MHLIKRTACIYFMLVFIIVFCICTSGCSGLPKDNASTAASGSKDIRTSEVIYGNISASFVGNGLMVPAKTTSLYYRDISGPLKAILVKQGETVKAGKAIAIIDPINISDTIADQRLVVSRWPTRLLQIDENLRNLESNMKQAKLAVDAAKKAQKANNSTKTAEDDTETILDEIDNKKLAAEYEAANSAYKQALADKEIAKLDYETDVDNLQKIQLAIHTEQELRNQERVIAQSKIKLKLMDDAINNAKISLDQAKLALDNAPKISKNKKIAKDNQRSIDQLNQAKDIQQMEAQYAQAKSAYQNALWEKSLSELDYERDKKALERLNNSLNNKVLKTPVTGTAVFVESLYLNEMVNSGQIIARIADNSKTFFRMSYVDKRYIYGVEKASLKIDNKSYDVTLYSPQPGDQFLAENNGASNSNYIYFKFISAPPDLGLNKMTKAEVQITKADTLLIPRSALHESNGKNLVDFKNGNAIESVEIERGLANDAMVEVLSGLKLGQKIIINY